MKHYYKWGINGEEISEEESIRICENNMRIIEESERTGSCEGFSEIVLIFVYEK